MKTIKQLESFLQNLDGFDEPKIKLEQYITPPHIASLVLNEINRKGDLDGKIVADLGCGSGMLSIGSIFCGARMVYGFDIDDQALRSTLSNINQSLGETDDESDQNEMAYRVAGNFSLIQTDVGSADYDNFWIPWNKMFDTVIMNPPFGTKKNQGLDMAFLERAINLSAKSVYSLHKSSTRGFIQRKIHQLGLRGKPVAQLRYNLENTYRFHRKNSVDIDVDLWHIKCSNYNFSDDPRPG